MKKKFGFLFLILVILTQPVLALEKTKASEKDLSLIKDLIQKWDKSASLVQKNDIETDDCENNLNHPGYVKSDFTGDGNTDYAVLTRLGKIKKIKNSSGEEFERADYCFLIFLGSKKNVFQTIVLEKISQYAYPTIVEVEAVKKGVVVRVPAELYDQSRQKKIKLKTTAINLIYCGKSSSVYYWNLDLKKFENVPAGD